MSDKVAFYKKLKESLENTTVFPADYLYKFIVPAKDNGVQEIEALFEKKRAAISTKDSKTGKYISVSVKVKLASADEVISYYEQAASIEGIISL